jgi:hypothetical protein
MTLKSFFAKLIFNLSHGECPYCHNILPLKMLFIHTAFRQCKLYSANERERGRQKLKSKKR